MNGTTSYIVPKMGISVNRETAHPAGIIRVGRVSILGLMEFDFNKACSSEGYTEMFLVHSISHNRKRSLRCNFIKSTEILGWIRIRSVCLMHDILLTVSNWNACTNPRLESSYRLVTSVVDGDSLLPGCLLNPIYWDLIYIILVNHSSQVWGS